MCSLPFFCTSHSSELIAFMCQQLNINITAINFEWAKSKREKTNYILQCKWKIISIHCASNVIWFCEGYCISQFIFTMLMSMECKKEIHKIKFVTVFLYKKKWRNSPSLRLNDWAGRCTSLFMNAFIIFSRSIVDSKTTNSPEKKCREKNIEVNNSRKLWFER